MSEEARRLNAIFEQEREIFRKEAAEALEKLQIRLFNALLREREALSRLDEAESVISRAVPWLRNGPNICADWEVAAKQALKILTERREDS